MEAATSAFLWRIERACRDAWPGIDEAEYGDWLLRYSGGGSRRANSANPLRDPGRDIDAALATCEEFYRQRGRPAFFRIPSFLAAEVDANLLSRGYESEGETLTLFGAIDRLAAGQDTEIEIRAFPSAEWLAAMNRAQGHSEAQRSAYAGIVGRIGEPSAFAALRHDDELASLAIGVIRDRFLCFESVVTDARHRGHGYARRILANLVAWAQQRSAEGACLQVAADNAVAISLYHRLGLRTEAYRYHYRCKPI